jgi:hypothetical protein
MNALTALDLVRGMFQVSFVRLTRGFSRGAHNRAERGRLQAVVRRRI